MELNKVPLDDDNMMQGKTREVCYAVDENGNYTTALSPGWEPKNIVFKQVWSVINDKIDETKRLVISGEISPIAYFMEKNLMDIKLLAQYMDLPKRKVKKHFEPNEFSKIPLETLNKYAEVFNISVTDLNKIDE